MTTPTFILGKNNWSVKQGNAMAYTPFNNGYVPRPLTFTRASDATVTASDLTLRPACYNRLTYSTTFSNAAWVKSQATVNSVTINSPIGTTDAFSFIEDNTNNQHRLYQNNTTVGVLTTSIYVKYLSRQYFGIRLYNNDGTKYVLQLFDVLNGTVGAQSALGVTGTGSIQSVGDGWYRCTLTLGATIDNANVLYWLSNSNTITDAGGTTYTGDGVSGVYVWGAQLVTGSQPLNYMATTDRLNLPRVDYSLGTPCMLLEPQRTNLALYSDVFSNAVWQKGGTVTLNHNAYLSPDGSINATGIVTSGISSFYQSVMMTATVVYTVSMYVKSNGGINNTFRLFGDSIQLSADFTATANWQRYTYTFTAGSSVLRPAGITRSSLNAPMDLQIYGFQLEAGSFPTTYIPTTTASVTRNADSFTLSNIYTNSLISSAGGTWFVELSNNVVYTRDAQSSGVFISTNSLGSGSGVDTIGLQNTGASNSRLVIYRRISNVFASLYTLTTDNVKIAIKWNGVTADVFVNGAKVVSSTTFTTTLMENLNSINSDVPKFIKEMRLYDSPLSDSECSEITSI